MEICRIKTEIRGVLTAYPHSEVGSEIFLEVADISELIVVKNEFGQPRGFVPPELSKILIALIKNDMVTISGVQWSSYGVEIIVSKN